MSINIEHIVEAYRDKILDLSLYIRNNPEIGLKEFLASEKLVEMLKKEGFEVKFDFKEMPTAFVARKKSGEGPVIALMAEYDALPGIGNACGHNLIAAMSFGAAVALSKALEEYPGEVILMGTPAEELGEGKPFLIKQGEFDDVDVAMMIHPNSKTYLDVPVLAIGGIDFHFYGKAAHAAANPYMGVNALDAVILFFNNINALRQQLRDDARVHGIIIEAGSAANSIPDKSKVRLEMRAKDQKYFLELIEKVKKCAEAAALATGCRLEWNHFEPNCDSLKANQSMLDIYKQHLDAFNIKLDPCNETGSTDMGNVSQVVPSIHPWLKMIEGDAGLHTQEFLDETASEFAKEKTIIGAKLLALTGLEILKNSNRLIEIKKEFNEN
ncbi:M20 family metallopeptidase [Sedimentibacter sp. B4]|uniref:M20 family metallopeptidase n=1 Tax=Sedimentibacter sp. B4 TaxID=304766 RepID=UPI0003087EC7|nr:M20 family metallopeptidase [Sedimentibacter sp. B4]